MDTTLAPPAANAVLLLNGKDVSNWNARKGGPAGWKVEDKILHVVPGTGDIVSKELFTDFFLHLEFRCPDMPEATGQAKGNSGVYLQGRYEIQVLDSFGIEVPGKGDCGGIYDQYAPLVNACKPALEWQTYDVAFRAARCEGGTVVDRARLTVIFNGQVIQNNVITNGPTGGAVGQDETQPGPLLLQDHSNLVCYRNIWAVHLPLEGSDKY